MSLFSNPATKAMTYASDLMSQGYDGNTAVKMANEKYGTNLTYTGTDDMATRTSTSTGISNRTTTPATPSTTSTPHVRDSYDPRSGYGVQTTDLNLSVVRASSTFIDPATAREGYVIVIGTEGAYKGKYLEVLAEKASEYGPRLLMASDTAISNVNIPDGYTQVKEQKSDGTFIYKVLPSGVAENYGTPVVYAISNRGGQVEQQTRDSSSSSSSSTYYNSSTGYRSVTPAQEEALAQRQELDTNAKQVRDDLVKEGYGIVEASLMVEDYYKQNGVTYKFADITDAQRQASKQGTTTTTTTTTATTDTAPPLDMAEATEVRDMLVEQGYSLDDANWMINDYYKTTVFPTSKDYSNGNPYFESPEGNATDNTAEASEGSGAGKWLLFGGLALAVVLAASSKKKDKKR